MSLFSLSIAIFDEIFIIFYYCQSGSGICLSKSKILRCLLEGTAAANVESIGEEEKDAADGSPYDSSAGHMLSSLLLGSKFLFIVAICW